MHVQPTLSLPQHGTATRAKPALLIKPWIVHQVPITAGWTEAVDSELAQGFAHMTGAATIGPQDLRSLVQRLNRSVTRSTLRTQ